MARDKDIKVIRDIIHALKDHEKSTGQFEKGYTGGINYAVNLLETWLRELIGENKLIEEYNNLSCYIDELDESQKEAYDRMVEFDKRLKVLENANKVD